MYGSCVCRRSANESAVWMIGQGGPYATDFLANGSVDGYSADMHDNLIIKNITKNDDRNGTEYRCGAISRATPGAFSSFVKMGNITILYVAGEYCDSIAAVKNQWNGILE